jgi:hypothetical protein
MVVKDRIEKAIESCKRALDDLENGNKRLALGDLDFVQDRITAAKMLLISQIKGEEGEI